MLGNVDTYSFVFDPYVPEVVESQLSDDLTSIASDLENGLRHYRSGDIDEALWWWQFSYVSSWGNLAGAALNALLSVVSHDRARQREEIEQIEVAEEILDGIRLGSLRPGLLRDARHARCLRCPKDNQGTTSPRTPRHHSAGRARRLTGRRPTPRYRHFANPRSTD